MKPCSPKQTRNRSTGRCRKSLKKPCKTGDTRCRKSLRRKSVKITRQIRNRSTELREAGVDELEQVETLPDDEEIYYLFKRFNIKPKFNLNLEIMKFATIFEQKRNIRINKFFQ